MPSVALALAWHALWAQPAIVARPPAPLVLEWSSSAGCEGGQDVEAEVGRLLRSAQGEERPVRAAAELSDGGHGSLQVTLQLEVAGTPHERAFLAESCKAAKSAIALILAIAINPAAAQSESPGQSASPDAEPSPGGAAQPPVTLARQTAAQPTSPRAASDEPRGMLDTSVARNWSFDAGADALLELGSMPRADAGLSLRLGLEIDAARLELGGSLLAAQTVLDATGAGARFSSLQAQLRFGYGARLSGVWLGPMVGFGLLSLTATGTKGSASVSARAATELVPELSAGGMTVWTPVRRFGLHLGADLVVPLVRPRFLVIQPAPEEPTVLHRSSRVGGRVMLGLAVQFL